MSTADPQDFTFDQIHIDAARNATDDFNLFHDPHKWTRIAQNPFDGPIVLGFQLECLLEHRISLHRASNGEASLLAREGMIYSNYQFSFANAVRPGEPVSVEIRPSQLQESPVRALSNRIVIRKGRSLVLTGYKKETSNPLFVPELPDNLLADLPQSPDRSYIPGTDWFHKRKYVNTGNAKNYLCGSLVDQAQYIDELENKVRFPEMFPAGLLSCALLERAMHEKHDFERNPLVYTSHQISINHQHARDLKSNSVLHLAVSAPLPVIAKSGLSGSREGQLEYHCIIATGNGDLLLSAVIGLSPLA